MTPLDKAIKQYEKNPSIWNYYAMLEAAKNS